MHGERPHPVGPISDRLFWKVLNVVLLCFKELKLCFTFVCLFLFFWELVGNIFIHIFAVKYRNVSATPHTADDHQRTVKSLLESSVCCTVSSH